MSEKPNCYNCRFRYDIPGDAHSECRHPDFENILNNSELQLFAMLGAHMIVPDSPNCIVRGNPHGISHGWFNHPFNFDPIWLVSCTGFQEKEKIDV